MDAQRQQIRDVIAVARLYQRAVVPYYSMEYQTFGLASDIDGSIEWHWRTDHRGFRGHGGASQGVPASWTFTREWLDGFRSRPAPGEG